MPLLVELRNSNNPGSDLELLSLALTRDDALRGIAIEPRLAPEDQHTMGPLVDALIVGLGSGGVGVALLHSLSAWLQSRRSDLRIKLTTAAEVIELDMHNLSDPSQFADILRAIQRADDRGLPS
jgi:hypothetical protein